ncbi:MAG TPA: enoyl-CoA hydratase-related protein [Dehalococcoidia bacterium]|nr:enoyl-CoA hydratase-related protein [Dehalococcoidia bacterium]
MSYEQVITEQRGRVGVVTLNKPDRLNALGEPMDSEMRDAIEGFNADPGVGAIVLTGSGRAFCAGADIQGWDRGIQQSEERGDQMRLRGGRRESWTEFVLRSKPVVVALNGVAIGAGLTITLPCDVRIASQQARLSMRFVRVGVFPELASTRILVEIVGLTHALELMLSGRIIDAKEAGRIGLVNRVVAPDELLDAAIGTAAEIAFNPAESVAGVKRTVWANLFASDLREMMVCEVEEFNAAMARPHFKEAVRAFLEKRQPDFHRV